MTISFLRRYMMVSSVASWLLIASAAAAAPLAGRLVDLTYPFDATTIYWPTEEGFVLTTEHSGVTDKGYFYASNAFCTPEHGGTHLDAPLHFWQSGVPVDGVPLDQLIGAAVLVDVTEKVRANRDYQIATEDFLAWEKSNGRIPDGAIVLIRTGLGQSWPDRRRYLGTDERGPEAVAKLHFPGLLPHAAEWLVSNRKIHAVGLDTASIDYGQSKLFESHVTLFRHGVPAFENVANLERLPAKGFTVIALPMKIRGGSGGPLRIVAVVAK